MQTVYLVEGEHPYVGGVRRSLHRTQESARRAAIELANIMLGNCKYPKLPADATKEQIESAVDRIQEESDDADVSCYVIIAEMPVEG
jgi:hypothetical protein